MDFMQMWKKLKTTMGILGLDAEENKNPQWKCGLYAYAEDDERSQWKCGLYANVEEIEHSGNVGFYGTCICRK